jgi:quinol monooxygenase YgiN
LCITGLSGKLQSEILKSGKEINMLIVHVLADVKPDKVEAFKAATLENARNSVKEQGVARFDCYQQQDNPTRFVLVEVYRTPQDANKHKETLHYTKWRDAVADMMAQPRTSIKYTNIFPNDKGWD